MLSSDKKKWATNPQRRHGGALNAITKQKKPVWKDYILSDSDYMTFWKR